ncbi:hypothetical protein ACJ2CR_19355 [Myxococcus faecalis]|uniref:hypothetical protein n=1 Tax=Myxococcus faecalis TaxID=3115646 RepID=UPI0038CF4342
MKIKVKFKRSGSASVKSFVNSKPLNFGADGVAVAEVDPGQHPLTWVVIGAPSQTYTIAITEPESCKFSHSATLDSAQKDSGLQWFTV